MLKKMQKGNTTYAVYDINGLNVEFDEVSIMMINNNRDKKTGLAPIFSESMNGVCSKLLFDITGKVPMSEYLKENHTQTEFKTLMLNLVETIECFDEYMIEVNQIMFDLESVYINIIDGTISFICIAIMDYVQQRTMYDFFKNIVSEYYPTDDNSELRYYKNVRDVTRTQGGFSLENIKKALNNATEISTPHTQQYHEPAQQIVFPPKQNIVETPVAEQGTVTVSPETELDKCADIVQTQNEKTKKGFLESIFGGRKKKKTEVTTSKFQSGLASLKGGKKQEAPVDNESVRQQEADNSKVVNKQGTTVLNANNQQYPRNIGTTVLNTNNNSYNSPGTTVLKQNMIQKQFFLVRIKNNQKFYVNKDVVRIGRDEPNIDINISDNTAVGHRHANIVKKENGYYLIDLNSKNYTYINNVMLQSGEEKLLCNGDIIIFANVLA